jgi:uncharacterized membrane protein YkvA (DUF1232 family)
MAQNPFFKLAMNKAADLLGKKGRLISLITKLGLKMQHVNWREIQKAGIKQKVFVLGRLLKAYALGKYKSIPWKTILLITAGVVYFVNPIDLVPDWIPALGLTDDVSILIAVYSALQNEIDKFLTWEKSQVIEV